MASKNANQKQCKFIIKKTGKQCSLNATIEGFCVTHWQMVNLVDRGPGEERVVVVKEPLFEKVV